MTLPDILEIITLDKPFVTFATESDSFILYKIPIMSKFAEAVNLYKTEMTKLGIKYDETLLTAVAKGLGPSIYLADASKVSCSDSKELTTVKNNFLIKKMGLTDGPKLDDALKYACDTMGSANRNKYRAIFYYLLVTKLGLQSKYK